MGELITYNSYNTYFPVPTWPKQFVVTELQVLNYNSFSSTRKHVLIQYIPFISTGQFFWGDPHNWTSAVFLKHHPETPKSPCLYHWIIYCSKAYSSTLCQWGQSFCQSIDTTHEDVHLLGDILFATQIAGCCSTKFQKITRKPGRWINKTWVI